MKVDTRELNEGAPKSDLAGKRPFGTLAGGLGVPALLMPNRGDSTAPRLIWERKSN